MSVSRNRVGFTLIELLVVIAVIAILAAFLFPVFAQARAKAWQASCHSNHKQMGAAVMLYLQDYDETFPGGGSEGTTPYLLAVPGPEGSWQSMPSRCWVTWRASVSRPDFSPTSRTSRCSSSQPIRRVIVWSTCSPSRRTRVVANKGPYTWNMFDPDRPVDIETVCRPKCVEVALQGE